MVCRYIVRALLRQSYSLPARQHSSHGELHLLRGGTRVYRNTNNRRTVEERRQFSMVARRSGSRRAAMAKRTLSRTFKALQSQVGRSGWHLPPLRTRAGHLASPNENLLLMTTNESLVDSVAWRRPPGRSLRTSEMRHGFGKKCTSPLLLTTRTCREICSKSPSHFS